MKFNHLLHTQEGKTLEFKRDLSSPENIMKTLVAFANTAGGVMLLGVEDNRTVIGIPDNSLDEEERLSNMIPEPEIVEIGMRVRLTIYLAKPMSVKRTEHNRSSEAHAEAHALSKTEKQILEACQDSPLSSSQLLDVLGYKSRTGNFKKALSSLLHKKLLVRTIPNAPRSGKQKYKINT